MKTVTVAVSVVVVAFSILCSHLLAPAQKRVAAAAQSKQSTPVAVWFSDGDQCTAVSPDGKPVRVAMAWQELENYDRIETQRKLDKLAGRTPWPYGTYTVASGTKCEVRTQRKSMVEVMWLEGPDIQKTAWVYANNLQGDRK